MTAAAPDSFPLAVLVAKVASLSLVVAAPAEQDSDRVVETLGMVRDMIPGAHWATLSAPDVNGSLQTVEASDSPARAADGAQFDLGSGATIEAVRHRHLVLVDDLTTDPRWPGLAERLAGDNRVRSMLTVPVVGWTSGPGALTLYGGPAHRFADDASTVALTIAGTAIAGLAQRQVAATLHRRLLANRRIGIAVGMLMAQYQWTEDRALDALTATSDTAHRDPEDVANDIIHTGILPTA